MLNNELSGLGKRPRSTRPMLLHPPQYTLAPGIHQAKEQDKYENTHFNKTERAIALELCGPWENENCFHVEDHEEQRENVITNLALRPTFTDWIDTAFIRQQLLAVWF